MENELYGPCKFCGGTSGHEATCPRIIQRTAMEMMKCVSLRDYFAGQAITGVLAAEQDMAGFSSFQGVAMAAYKLADAMLAERAKSTEAHHAD